MGATINSSTLENRNNFNMVIPANIARVRENNNLPIDLPQINERAVAARERQQNTQQMRELLNEIISDHEEEKQALDKWSDKVDKFCIEVDEFGKKLAEVERDLYIYIAKLNANKLSRLNSNAPDNIRGYKTTTFASKESMSLAERIAKDNTESRENLEKALKIADERIAKIREVREFKESLDRLFYASAFWRPLSIFKSPLLSLKMFFSGF